MLLFVSLPGRILNFFQDPVDMYPGDPAPHGELLGRQPIQISAHIDPVPQIPASPELPTPLIQQPVPGSDQFLSFGDSFIQSLLFHVDQVAVEGVRPGIAGAATGRFSWIYRSGLCSIKQGCRFIQKLAVTVLYLQILAPETFIFQAKHIGSLLSVDQADSHQRRADDQADPDTRCHFNHLLQTNEAETSFRILL